MMSCKFRIFYNALNPSKSSLYGFPFPNKADVPSINPFTPILDNVSTLSGEHAPSNITSYPYFSFNSINSLIFSSTELIYYCPANPGLTLITITYLTNGNNGLIVATAVPGLIAIPGIAPASIIDCKVLVG